MNGIAFGRKGAFMDDKGLAKKMVLVDAFVLQGVCVRHENSLFCVDMTRLF